MFLKQRAAAFTIAIFVSCRRHGDASLIKSRWNDVVADIRQHGARKLIFVDLNLIADRGYALRLFTALIPLKLQWYGLATVLLADDLELLELAARSGCRGLLMGLESISPQNLRAKPQRIQFAGKICPRRRTPA